MRSALIPGELQNADVEWLAANGSRQQVPVAMASIHLLKRLVGVP
jgi:hypothetical protein